MLVLAGEDKTRRDLDLQKKFAKALARFPSTRGQRFIEESIILLAVADQNHTDHQVSLLDPEARCTGRHCVLRARPHLSGLQAPAYTTRRKPQQGAALRGR